MRRGRGGAAAEQPGCELEAGGEEEEVAPRLVESRTLEEGGAHGGRARPFRGKGRPGGWGRRDQGKPGGEIHAGICKAGRRGCPWWGWKRGALRMSKVRERGQGLGG